MRLLLDTHFLLWIALGQRQVPADALLLLRDRKNELWFSSVSIWEVAIKYGRGRPDFSLHPRELRDGLLAHGYRKLLITSEHIFRVVQLPPIHRDPFDRLLLAQAIEENLTFLTEDSEILKYPGPIYRS